MRSDMFSSICGKSGLSEDVRALTIVEVIPLGHAETGAETMANESGTVRLELVSDEGE